MTRDIGSGSVEWTRMAIGLSLLAFGVGCGSSTGGAPASGGAGQSAMAGGGNAGSTSGAAGTVGGGASGTGGVSGAGGAGNATGSGSATDACTAYAAAYCAFVQSCQINAFNDVFGTTENCTSGHFASCMDRFIALGNQTTPATLTACAESLTPTSCDAVHPACAFQGILANGTACAYDAQCQSKVCKVSNYGAPCGVCDAPAPKGGACHQSNGCAAGLQCGREVCVNALPQGSVCDQTQYECAGMLDCVNGTCQPPPGLKQPCNALYTHCSETDDAECLNGVCQKLVWSTVGGDCNAANGVLCLGGLECNPVGGPGKCELATPRAPTLAADCK